MINVGKLVAPDITLQSPRFMMAEFGIGTRPFWLSNCPDVVRSTHSGRLAVACWGELRVAAVLQDHDGEKGHRRAEVADAISRDNHFVRK